MDCVSVKEPSVGFDFFHSASASAVFRSMEMSCKVFRMTLIAFQNITHLLAYFLL